MSDFILKKQKKNTVKVTGRIPSISKKLSKFVKPFLASIVYGIFVMMSIKSDNLFLTELLVSGSIIAMLYFVHLMSQKQ